MGTLTAATSITGVGTVPAAGGSFNAGESTATTAMIARTTMIELKDTDFMPFGKHKGEPMQDVPASYLHYLWQNGLKQDKRSDVADYIRRNLNALRQEHPDGVWT
jgi:uncharacterized protein (DUF3820 family)